MDMDVYCIKKKHPLDMFVISKVRNFLKSFCEDFLMNFIDFVIYLFDHLVVR